MAVSKRLRYEVLRRDGHACQYCGAKAPDVELTADHVVPVALGGTDEPTNLVAACSDCNGGKTSSTPDAPLVADVAEDALRWAQAIQQAQTKALADLKARGADRRKFTKWWNAWTYELNGKRHTFPRPGDWGRTVDQLVSAGLPLPLLESCIDRALGSVKIARDDKFRYMCGVAWKRLAEIQKEAGGIVSGVPPGEAQEPAGNPYEQGRADFARELLNEMTDEESQHFLEYADTREYQEEGEEPQTDTQIACDAAMSALNSARCNLDWLANQVKETITECFGEAGDRAIAEIAAGGFGSDPLGRRACDMTLALYAVRDLIEFPQADAFMTAMPEAERLEWLQFAGSVGERSNLTPERLTAWAACCARAIADGRHYNDMCTCHGQVIPDCPRRGKYLVRSAELDCCQPGGPEDHKGHLVCEQHLEQIVDGSYVGRGGKPFSAVDFTEAHPDPWAA